LRHSLAAYAIQMFHANKAAINMKRSHQKWHKVIWVSLAPILAVLLGLSYVNRPGIPINDALPQIFVEDTE